jgi:hypothetical protein
MHHVAGWPCRLSYLLNLPAATFARNASGRFRTRGDGEYAPLIKLTPLGTARADSTLEDGTISY